MVVRRGESSIISRMESISRIRFDRNQRSTSDYVRRLPDYRLIIDELISGSIRTEFEEGTTSFFCKIFFAEQFDALRRNCGCDSQFIESLARCVKWESSGGRSKVDFLKTRGSSRFCSFVTTRD